jgi:predicted kinase
MNPAKLQVLVGMIASGKSTYARNAARQGVICLNDDAIVNLLHADDYTLYDKGLKLLYKTVENHIIGTALAMRRTVMVDRGLNVSVAGRRRWLALAKSFDVRCEALLFKNEGPVVHAQRRADSDARGHDLAYWLEVAEAHHDSYAPPTLEEGFDRVKAVSWEEIKEGKVIL